MATKKSNKAIEAQLARFEQSGVFRRAAVELAFLKALLKPEITTRFEKGESGADIGTHIYQEELHRKPRRAGDDPIGAVKKIVKALRLRLAKYYLEYPDDPVVISIPTGSFRPEVKYGEPNKSSLSSVVASTFEPPYDVDALWDYTCKSDTRELGGTVRIEVTTHSFGVALKLSGKRLWLRNVPTNETPHPKRRQITVPWSGAGAFFSAREMCWRVEQRGFTPIIGFTEILITDADIRKGKVKTMSGRARQFETEAGQATQKMEEADIAMTRRDQKPKGRAVAKASK